MVSKVIIDTDAGVDDAVAIFMMLEAHKNKQIEVIAITTVNGNTSLENVNVNVLRILKTAGLLTIPVYSGASNTLVIPYDFPEDPFHGFDGFGDATHDELPPPLSLIKDEVAAIALIRLIEESPGEIILAALGPLTNLAVMLNIKPDITLKLKDIFVMGGNVTGQGNTTLMGEFNFVCDPEAAKVVLDRTKIKIKLTPWEACIDAVAVSYEERDVLGSSKTAASRLINKIEENIIRGKYYKNWVSCDQMATAWLLDECMEKEKTTRTQSLVTEKSSFYATVELHGLHSRGQMVIDNADSLQKKHNILVLKELNKETYMSYLRMAFNCDT